MVVEFNIDVGQLAMLVNDPIKYLQKLLKLAKEQESLDAEVKVYVKF